MESTTIAIGALIIFIFGRFTGKHAVIEDSKIKELRKVKEAYSTLDKRIAEENKKLRSQENLLRVKEQDIDEKERIRVEKEQVFKELIEEKTKKVPWVAELYSNYATAYDESLSAWLIRKKNPAPSAAETVKEIRREKKELLKHNAMLSYYMKYYESLFPWLEDLKDQEVIDSMEIDESASGNQTNKEDPVYKYLNDKDYSNLTSAQRNQLALDRYKQTRHSKVHVGRMYERYVGYLYEQKGYKVIYQGIMKGYEDWGRDLICLKDGKVEVVQCKCWSIHKKIHENTINQLYGTTVKYWTEHGIKSVGNQMSLFGGRVNLADFIYNYEHGFIKAVLYTSTEISDSAKKFSEALGVTIRENVKLADYPMIKCNINTTTGDKIYHLPFDQQYDKVLIQNKDEFYAATVKEAEDKGFRRAYRWQGNNN